MERGVRSILSHSISFGSFVIFLSTGCRGFDRKYIVIEQEEFRRLLESENSLLEDENDRQNHRLNTLENSIQQIAAISTSVEKLATNIENMLKEQVSQGKRLETLEHRDGDMWRKAVGHVVTVVIGIAIGYIFRQIGM